ncbi:putative nucleic-acid-binding protein [Salinibacter ruber]|nr:putative nucleic-acid-binding protein [Salinibacter ruber]
MSLIVLCDLARVPVSAHEAMGEGVARTVDQVLRTRQLQVERLDQVRVALAQYKISKVDFADCLIGRLRAEAGSDETVTSDQDAARRRGWGELDW